MPRSIVTGNGNLLIAMDKDNMIRDIYFPFVGMENHVGFGDWHRIGIFADKKDFSWLYTDDWRHTSNYIEDTIVTESYSTNEHLGLEFIYNDLVYPTDNFLLRKLTVKNNHDYNRNIKVFFNQDLHLYGDKQQDTAFYEPDNKAVIHYRKRRYFWVSGMTDDHSGVDSFTTGKSEYRGLEGTWRDAEDGSLHEHAIEQGSVDSTIQFDIHIPARGETIFFYWMCAGRTLKEVKKLHNFILEETPEKLLQNTIDYWQSWVNKDEREFTISPELQGHLKQSLLIIRTQTDNRGAIIAANDSDIMKFNKDTYTYMWPRDGAWVALALDRAGYGEISERFFRFCADTVTKEGYLLPKYNPDRSAGSNWHPWIAKGKKQLPIQEDESAIVLYVLNEHFEIFRNIEFMQEMYLPLIRSVGNFLMSYTDIPTGLPLPTYDLWERERGVSSYTCSAVYAGLHAASELCKALGHHNHYERYKKAAANIKNSILKYLYDPDAKRFLKRIYYENQDVEMKKDYIIDASLHGLWLFGVLPPDDERIISTNEAVYNTLKIPAQAGGLARYEHDDYQRTEGDYHNIPGNPWIITTLWHAQWKLALAKTKEDLKETEDALSWAISHMNSAGILPEQLNPFNGEHLSVAPLTWSHSTFVDTMLWYDEKLKELS